MERITKRNYYGKAYVPGYAPKCDDPKTCELIVLLVERLAELEDVIYETGNPVSVRDLRHDV